MPSNPAYTVVVACGSPWGALAQGDRIHLDEQRRGLALLHTPQGYRCLFLQHAFTSHDEDAFIRQGLAAGTLTVKA